MSKKRKNRANNNKSNKKKNNSKAQNNQKDNTKHQSEHLTKKDIVEYIIIFLIALFLASHLNVVVSGSMEPTFYRGDIVVVQNVHAPYYGLEELDPYNDIEVGDVVIYNAKWYPDPVIHRVISIDEINGSKYYTIKGDNNEAADPYLVSPDQISGRVLSLGGNLLIIPKIGYVTLFFQEQVIPTIWNIFVPTSG